MAIKNTLKTMKMWEFLFDEDECFVVVDLFILWIHTISGMHPLLPAPLLVGGRLTLRDIFCSSSVAGPRFNDLEVDRVSIRMNVLRVDAVTS